MEYKKFEDHYPTCNDCSRIVSEFQTLLSIIERKKSDEPNPFLQTRTLQRLDSHPELDKSTSFLVIQRILRPVSLSLLFLSAILIGLIIVNPWGIQFTDDLKQQNDIQVMKSGLNIPDFIDEDLTFFEN
jgi:hypothetical protein